MNEHDMVEALSLPVNLCLVLNDGWELLGAKRLDQEHKLQMWVSSVGRPNEELLLVLQRSQLKGFGHLGEMPKKI